MTRQQERLTSIPHNWSKTYTKHHPYQSLKEKTNTFKSRPCGFGQSLGPPIVRSISHFFWSTEKKFVQSQIFFVHSLEFFVQSFSKNEKLTGQLDSQDTDQNQIFKKDWTKISSE